MRKQSNKYYFSVEGETEKWYLEWLSNEINKSDAAICKVSLVCKIQKDPAKFVKGLTVQSKTKIVHMFDRESEDVIHTEQFTATLRSMKAASLLGKTVTYKLGYSNFTFELWMVLHKADCNGSKNHRRDYLDPINRAYDEHFEDLDKFKNEGNFKRVLRKLTLEDVHHAIRRSKAIRQRNIEARYTLREESGFKYYIENPSLSLWEHIEKMLEECGLV